jgi:hypothetical protein
MGELLKDLMHERAAAEAPPDLDLDAIVRAGDRRVWRHRVVTGVAAAAVVGAAAVAAPTVLDQVRDDSAPATDQTTAPEPTEVAFSGGFETRRTTYAVGSTIHYGDETIDVSPHVVAAFVQTDDGFVVASTDGTIILANGRSIGPIGSTVLRPGYAALVADEGGSLVSWAAPIQTGGTLFVVFDTATRTEVALVSNPGASSGDEDDEFGLPVVEALDGSTVYLHRSDGTVAFDIDSRETTMLQEGASPDWLKDVEDGTLAFASFDDQAVVVSPDPNADGPLLPGYTESAWLSSSATYLATEQQPGTFVVREVESGGDVTMPGSATTAWFVEWASDSEYIAADLMAQDSVSFRKCLIEAQQCTVTTGTVGDRAAVVLPDGVIR